MRQLLIDSVPGERRFALMDEAGLLDILIDRDCHPARRGGIYKARVTHVVRSAGTAFVDLGVEEALLNFRGHPPVEGSSLIVQVATDAHAEKEARVNATLRLAGRFAVFAPGGKDVTVSQKIRDRHTRGRLSHLVPKGLPGRVTIRSRAALAEPEMVEAEIADLTKRWSAIEAEAREAEAPHCLSAPPTALERTMTEWIDPDVEVVIDSPTLLHDVALAMRERAPDVPGRPYLEVDPDLFTKRGAEADIAAALDPLIPLSPAGRMSIYETPALTAVDIDSGSAESWMPETTADRVNAAAAQALVREVRRRQLGGIIAVDFIGWEIHLTRALDALRAALEADAFSSRPTGVGGLGLALFTRQRFGPSLAEQLRGRAAEGHALMRRIARQAAERPGAMTVAAHPDLIAFLEGEDRIGDLSRHLGRHVTLAPKDGLAKRAAAATIEIE